MKNNKKGAALMQVLLITIILAGICTMLLRASLSRTTSARKTRRTVSGQVLIQACMAEINTLWSRKHPKAFEDDLKDECVYRSKTSRECIKEYTCNIAHAGTTVQVKATIGKESVDGREYKTMVYEVLNPEVL